MAKGKLIGLYLFAGGMLLLIISGLYQFVQEISGIDAIVAIGAGAILLGDHNLDNINNPGTK
jgi:hypothetical protein